MKRYGIIHPYRYIPFDLGKNIEEEDVKKLINIFNSKGWPIVNENRLHRTISSYLLLRVRVSELLEVCFYNFGIGVIKVVDEDYICTDMRYAVDYCEKRRKVHADILSKSYLYSSEIEEIVSISRNAVNVDNKIRESATDDFEHNGISYVMTVSFIDLSSPFHDYQELDLDEKKSLQIMLEPSLVGQEDTDLLSSSLCEGVSYESINYDVEPQNYSNRVGVGVYISWSAVIVMQMGIDESYYRLFDALEMDLQAMWYYIYCLYNEVRKICDDLVLLKRIRNKAMVEFNEFYKLDDSSLPKYVFDIRKQLIETSGLNEEYNKLFQYIDSRVEERKYELEEQKQKYSQFVEVLLFFIAYFQIAPLIYAFLENGLEGYSIISILVVLIIALIGAFLVYKRDR